MIKETYCYQSLKFGTFVPSIIYGIITTMHNITLFYNFWTSILNILIVTD